MLFDTLSHKLSVKIMNYNSHKMHYCQLCNNKNLYTSHVCERCDRYCCHKCGIYHPEIIHGNVIIGPCISCFVDIREKITKDYWEWLTDTPYEPRSLKQYRIMYRLNDQ